jgi:hypothetical protein
MHLKRSQHIHVTNPWHAVGIVPSKPGCPACASLKNVRFLAREAPTLPLAECSSPSGCRCVYKHFGDRRSGPRRAAERWTFQSSQPAPGARAVRENRRQRAGRRATDGH